MLTIFYDPDCGHACPDGKIEACAGGALEMAREFGSHRIRTSTGLLIEAIIYLAAIWTPAAGGESVDVTLVAHGQEWTLAGACGGEQPDLRPGQRRLGAFGANWITK